MQEFAEKLTPQAKQFSFNSFMCKTMATEKNQKKQYFQIALVNPQTVAYCHLCYNKIKLMTSVYRMQ